MKSCKYISEVAFDFSKIFNHIVSISNEIILTGVIFCQTVLKFVNIQTKFFLCHLLITACMR